MLSKIEELLGNVIDIPNLELSMSRERPNEILYELKIMSNVKFVKKIKILSLIGKLSFITKVVRSGRTFLKCLINLAKSVKYLHYKVKMNVQARRDIVWWIENVTDNNDRCMFPLRWVTAKTIELWSDESDIGAGATFTNQWLCILFTSDKEHFKQFPIAWHELYVVVVMLKTWCHN